jgi:protein SCO1/2
MNKLLVAAIIVLALGACKQKQQKLPILGNREPIAKTVDGKTVTDTAYTTIPDFKFVNQYGDTITKKALKAIFMWPISFSPPALLFAR